MLEKNTYQPVLLGERADDFTRLGKSAQPNRYPLVVCQPEFMSAQECQEVIHSFSDLERSDGQVYHSKASPDLPGVITERGHRVDMSVRRAKTSLVPFAGQSKKVYAKIYHSVQKINDEFWRAEITGAERVEFLTYEPGSYFHWHHDVAESGPASLRKLLAVVQLTPSEDYQGGSLEFFLGPHDGHAPRDEGTLIVFPAFVFHRVHEILSGVRNVLIMTLLGERPFR